MNKECEGEEENLSITTSIFHRFVMLGFDVRRKKKKEENKCSEKTSRTTELQGRVVRMTARTTTSVVDEDGDERRWRGRRRASLMRTAASLGDEDSDQRRRRGQWHDKEGVDCKDYFLCVYSQSSASDVGKLP